jgi:hypothetical protein
LAAQGVASAVSGALSEARSVPCRSRHAPRTHTRTVNHLLNTREPVESQPKSCLCEKRVKTLLY